MSVASFSFFSSLGFSSSTDLVDYYQYTELISDLLSLLYCEPSTSQLGYSPKSNKHALQPFSEVSVDAYCLGVRKAYNPAEEATWEPWENLVPGAEEKLGEFHRRKPSSPKDQRATQLDIPFSLGEVLMVS